jgi:integrase
MVKKIAVYGSYLAKTPVRQRYWKKRADGLLQRYWKQTKRMKVVEMSGNLFLRINGLTWEKPRTNVVQKFPFIPTEQEIDALISGSGKKTATFLQLLKETAMRCGEAKRLQWTDIDFEKNIVTLNCPEKGSNPRMWKISAKLSAMLNNLPRESQRLFGEGPITSMKTTFIKARRRLAAKLQNPRLTKISFHTFRHWKATTEQHKTKDPWHVKTILGHKSIKSTEAYIHIEKMLYQNEANDQFTVKVANTLDDAVKLMEVGFEFHTEIEGNKLFRKRK